MQFSLLLVEIDKKKDKSMDKQLTVSLKNNLNKNKELE